MRIAYLSRRAWPARGGIESFLRRAARQMAERHDVTIVAQRTDSGVNRPVRDEVLCAPFAPYADGPVPVQPLKLSPIRRAALTPLLLQSAPRLRRPRDGRAQELMGAAFARIAAPPLARTLHGSDVLHVLGGYEIAAAGVRAGQLLGIPVLVSPFAHPGAWDDDAASAWAYRRATRVLATLDADAATYRALGVDDRRIEIVGLFSEAPPQDLSPDRLRARHGIAGRLVVFLGGRYAHKGVDVLLAAARHVPGATFAFVGPGPPVAGDRVIDAGAVDDRERWEWLAAADVLCLPSEAETFGLVLLEAWATGTPVVTSDIPVLAELVTRAGGGLAVPRTAEAFADALRQLLDDPARRRELAAAGRRYWHAHGRPEAIVARLEALYDAHLTSPGKPV
jgi:glycosyltransferase involved in cell wall biosynthesis